MKSNYRIVIACLLVLGLLAYSGCAPDPNEKPKRIIVPVETVTMGGKQVGKIVIPARTLDALEDLPPGLDQAKIIAIIPKYSGGGKYDISGAYLVSYTVLFRK